MGWRTGRLPGGPWDVVGITGSIGDPLAIRVRATFSDPTDFTEHTWLCQIRRSLSSTSPVATLELVNDSTTLEDGIDLLFQLDDTTVLTPGVRYVIGVRAIEGTYANWTALAGRPLIGSLPAAREEVTP